MALKTHNETRRLPYTPQQMFDLVADVARYPEFLPWCVGARIKEQQPDMVLADYAEAAKIPAYAEHLDIINHCFSRPTITDICLALKMDDDDWATTQADILKSRSPLSMAVSLEQLRRGAQMSSFEEIMRMEYRIACRIIRTHDFSEGVRAVIEEKDHAPKWSPETPSGVTKAMVEAMFEPVTEELAL